MKVGLLIGCDSADCPVTAQYDHLIQQAQVADEVGFQSLWIAESHFCREQPFPSPLSLAAAVAAVTTTIRIGTVLKLPFAHPIRIAEDAAVVDLLSGGRLLLGAAAEAEEAEFRGHNVPPAERWDRFCEALDIIVKAWTHDSFAYLGRYHRIPVLTRAVSTSAPFVAEPYKRPWLSPWKRAGLPLDYLSVLPKPIQMPHPPVFVSGTQENAIALAARKAYSLFLSSHESSAAVAEKAGKYWAALERAGREREEVSLVITRDVYVETDGRAAREHVSNATAHSFLGDPDEVFHEIKCLQQATGAAHIVCRMNLPGTSHGMVVESMKLFAAEVMTKLQV